MNAQRNLPAALRKPPAPDDATAETKPTPTAGTPAPAAARPSSPPASSATSSAPDKPRIIIHIAAPDPNILRHLQGQGRLRVWADHRTPADIEVRVRTHRPGTSDQQNKLEALLDEVFPGWTYIDKE